MTTPHWLQAIGSLLGMGAIGMAIRAGLLDAAGKWLFEKWLEPWLDRFRLFKGFGKKRKKKKGEFVMIKEIAGLRQKVMDQGKQLLEVKKIQKFVNKRLEACQAERTECRADLRNVLIRVSALERKS